MSNEKQKIYNVSIDFMRIFAILGVILVHVTTRTLEAGNFHLVHQQSTLFFNQISRFAVPMFFFISGFVLEVNYSLHTSYIQYFKKRVDRILLPYVFWSLIYYFFVYPHHSDTFFMALVSGSASYQLYFIPTLLIFYFVFPFLHKIYRFISSLWGMITLGVLQLLLLCADYYFHAIHLFYPLAIVSLNFYIFLLGIVLSHYQQRILILLKKWWILASILAVLFACIVFYEGYYFYQKTGNYLSIYSQWRVSIFVYTLSLSAVLYLAGTFFTSYRKVIKKLSSLSFFVFFIHVIILESVWSFFVLTFSQPARTWLIHQGWFDAIFFLTTAGLSFFIASLVHKIPKLNLVTG